MTTITINSNEKLSKTSFKNLAEVQEAILLSQMNAELSPQHIEILDARLKDLNDNPQADISLENLKKSITRRK